MDPRLAHDPHLAGHHGQVDEPLDDARQINRPIKIAHINCAKQLEILSFICQNNIDIMHL